MNKMVVFAKAAPGKREELTRWYDEQHIPDLLAVPGVASAERHDIVPLRQPPGSPEWDILMVYEFSGEDPMVVISEMGRRRGTERMPWTDALDGSATLSLIGTTLGRRAA